MLDPLSPCRVVHGAWCMGHGHRSKGAVGMVDRLSPCRLGMEHGAWEPLLYSATATQTPRVLNTQYSVLDGASVATKSNEKR